MSNPIKAIATTLSSHPKPLAGMFFTEMWERFSYYGMRAILVYYLSDQVINGGFGFSWQDAQQIAGIFIALVYITPILGGLFADKFIGQRRAVFIGGILMALGHMGLTMSEQNFTVETRTTWLTIGLGLLIIGNGFFKPNISTMVGQLYKADEINRKEVGFTIFYMGINLGAFAGGIISGYLGEKLGWSWGLGAATIGMIFGLIWFWFKSNQLNQIGLSPKKITEGDISFNKKDWKSILIWTFSSVLILVVGIFIWDIIPKAIQETILIISGSICLIVLFIIIGVNTKGSAEWSRNGAFVIFFIINVFFWTGFDQAVGSFSKFALDKTDRIIFGWEVPASWFVNLNPVFILILAPIFSLIWMRLQNKKLNPIKPIKFSLALAFLGIGFIIMSIADSKASSMNLVSPLWLVGVYLFHTMGELCLSPIGLSMVTDLSPKKLTNIMMGTWMTSYAIASILAQFMEEKILQVYYPNINIYVFLIYTSFGAALFVFVLSPLIKKLMRGMH